MRFVAVVDVADGKSQQVKDLLVREGAVSGGEHDGAEYFTGKDADGVVAVDDEALVFSDTKQQVFAALDAHQAGGDQTLAGTDKFTAPSPSCRPTSSARRTSTSAPSCRRRARPPGRRPTSSASPTSATPSWRRRSPPSPRAPA